MKFDIMQFEGPFKALIGQPEKTGTWLIWGNSGNGKTRLSLQLAKYLCQFDRVIYNTLEEGARESFRKALKETNMRSVNRRLIILHREPVAELRNRLSKRQSPRIVFIDSFQHARINYQEYMDLINEFPNHLFIFISHADGKQPSGRSARSVRYDADVKIWVEGYKAFATSRYGGGVPYIIWAQGAHDYWGEKITTNPTNNSDEQQD